MISMTLRLRQMQTQTQTQAMGAGACISSQHAWLAHSRCSRQSGCSPMHDSEIHALYHTHIIWHTNTTICVYKTKALSCTVTPPVTEISLFSVHKYTEIHMTVHVNEKHIASAQYSKAHKHNVLVSFHTFRLNQTIRRHFREHE